MRDSDPLKHGLPAENPRYTKAKHQHSSVLITQETNLKIPTTRNTRIKFGPVYCRRKTMCLPIGKISGRCSFQQVPHVHETSRGKRQYNEYNSNLVSNSQAYYSCPHHHHHHHRNLESLVRQSILPLAHDVSSRWGRAFAFRHDRVTDMTGICEEGALW